MLLKNIELFREIKLILIFGLNLNYCILHLALDFTYVYSPGEIVSLFSLTFNHKSITIF